VLVHCKQGVSRSASLVIAYVMCKERLTFQQAYALVREKSPSITPNLMLVYQLLEYERALGLSTESSVSDVIVEEQTSSSSSSGSGDEQ
jgi:tyrosine-protein phosphatase